MFNLNEFDKRILVLYFRFFFLKHAFYLLLACRSYTYVGRVEHFPVVLFDSGGFTEKLGGGCSINNMYGKFQIKGGGVAYIFPPAVSLFLTYETLKPKSSTGKYKVNWLAYLMTSNSIRLNL